MNKNEVVLDTIKKMIIGQFYNVIETGSLPWAFQFDNRIWLIAQDIEFIEENEINKCLKKCEFPILDTVDSQDIAKAIMSLFNNQILVTDVDLLEFSELLLSFENGSQMKIKTDTKIVDWHWSFSNENTSPYYETLVACFYPGEINL